MKPPTNTPRSVNKVFIFVRVDANRQGESFYGSTTTLDSKPSLSNKAHIADRLSLPPSKRAKTHET